MEEVKKYQVKLSVLFNSVNYCSDVEDDGYYVVKSTNEIVEYGEDLSDIPDKKIHDFVTSEQCFQLPTWHDLDNSYPNWAIDLPKKFISEKIHDEKAKKQLTKANNSIFNDYIPCIPGGTKFVKTLSKMGHYEMWNRYVDDEYYAFQLAFIKKWCDENNVEIVDD
ncbi:MAG: hypothetical protein K2J80_10575 [Oscillospiraceae bacterium]|nr:hypothetical protein [Oscillospiraceae bacterium]